jgi:hypothetical protein
MDAASAAAIRFYLVDQSDIALMRYTRNACYIDSKMGLQNLGGIREGDYPIRKIPEPEISWTTPEPKEGRRLHAIIGDKSRAPSVSGCFD